MNFGMITLNQNIKTEQNMDTDMDTDGFVIQRKTEHFYEDIANDIGLTHLTMINMIKDLFQ